LDEVNNDNGDDPELAVRWIGVGWNACDDDDAMITIMMIIIIRHKRHDNETVMVTVLLIFPEFVVFPLLNMIIIICFVSERLSGCLDNVFITDYCYVTVVSNRNDDGLDSNDVTVNNNNNKNDNHRKTVCVLGSNYTRPVRALIINSRSGKAALTFVSWV
jgi:hypothetical protein